jgi:hypothetical protein
MNMHSREGVRVDVSVGKEHVRSQTVLQHAQKLVNRCFPTHPSANHFCRQHIMYLPRVDPSLLLLSSYSSRYRLTKKKCLSARATASPVGDSAWMSILPSQLGAREDGPS